MADVFCLSFSRCINYFLVPSRTNILKFVLLFIFLCHVNSVYSLKNCRFCEEGNCINDTCVCLPGWRGGNCTECHGRISLTEKEGVIHDGSSNYSKNHSCSWLLDAGQHGRRVTLLINDLATECIWDHLYVHNGDSAFSPLVASYSGVRLENRSKPLLKFLLTGRYAFIHFYSDAAYTLPGFNVSYVVDNCSLECSENAICEQSQCECMPGWTGVHCDSLITGCPDNCTGHGDCDNGQCTCFDGFTGDNCYANDKYLKLERMPEAPTLMSGRASFAVAKDDSGSLWIIGGYRSGENGTTDNLLRYLIAKKEWSISPETNEGPWPRYGHTAVFYQGALYLYGGVRSLVVMNDFWKYDIAASKWEQLTSGPRDLNGHTAEVVGSKMLLFFGYSAEYGYSNKVLEYDFVKEDWSVVETKGSVVQGGYGHTSVHDELRNKIYVYGGYHSPGTITPYNLTDMLYEFEPTNAVWYILHSSGSGHYLHSAAMLNGLMLVFGGNMNNDTREGKHAECFTSEFYAYDRDCNQWSSVTRDVDLKSHMDDLDRFGQSMIAVGKEIYMFGGFHAWSKADLWKITAGMCSAYEDQKSCNASLPGIKCYWNTTNCITDLRSDRCQAKRDLNFDCSGFNRCEGCLARTKCKWCSNSCISTDSAESKNCTEQAASCASSVVKDCALYQSCKSCQKHSECEWSPGKCSAFVVEENSNKTKRECVDKKCSDQDSCASCTKSNCMWCSNLKQCILTNSYVASYFYGQCMDWTTKEAQCQVSTCSAMKTCADCIAKPRCGWCDDGSGTGTGSCYEGGMSGPMNTTISEPTVDLEICAENSWFFQDCPLCQCNGHSHCVNDTSVCNNCLSHTTGAQCQLCNDGYFGDPTNGGNCSACSCKDADSCNPVTGDCFCKIRGVIGPKCDRCDDDYKYIKKRFGDGTCFYHLNTDFSYTFNLSKREDSNYRQINFVNTPTSSDRDVDFTLNCSTLAFINITYVSKSHPVERDFVTYRLCDYFRTKFEHKNHAFGGKENTTFYVYVYSFKTPLTLQISFSQFPKIDLVHFFVTFFSCFLSLLLIAAALWKLKHKYDSYRRRRQLIVEMQQMASRPFSSVSVEIDRRSNHAALDKRDHLDSVLRRRKKGNKPSEVAIEPLVDSKAAILTLIIQLPTGEGEHSPAGQSGLAMGSALVSLGSHRKQSLDHAKGDKPKSRKHLSNIHADTCA